MSQQKAPLNYRLTFRLKSRRGKVQLSTILYLCTNTETIMGQQTKKYPIGIQTFEKIIKGGYVYVDKTDLIYKLVSEGEYYFLSRPRRFGKSLLITTLEAYFQGKKDLFRGLAIEKLEKDWDCYPVFHLDFSGESYTSADKVTNRIDSYLYEWEKAYGKNPVEIGVGNRMSGVLQRAVEKTGKQCVILIDEYDKPLTDTIDNEEVQDQNRAILQGLYGVLKNADRNIKFALLTGVTRYGKLGIFSANNNPKNISMDKNYGTICGITEEELHKYFDPDIQLFAEEEGIDTEKMYAILKHKYDGYHFTKKSADIYNPFSLLNSLSCQDTDNYWFATGTPSFLSILLKKNGFNPAVLEGEIKSSIENMSSFGNDENNIVAALYQSGYLTIKQFKDDYYVLGMPNEEVACGLTNYLIPNYSNTHSGQLDPAIIDLKDMLRTGNANGMMEQLQSILEEIPFENNEPKMIEAHFRNMFYLLIRATGYPTFVELPKLGGRLDVCFETEKFAYVIECKRDTSAETALAQIDLKKYDKRLSHKDKKLFKIGVNFSTKEKNIVEWKVEE